MSLNTMIRATGAMMVLILVAIVTIVLGYLAGPEIEARAFPIISASSIAGSTVRSEKTLCWMTHYRKLREGTPAYFSYRITHKRDSIPLAAFRVDGNRHVYLSTYGFADHYVGEIWDSLYCADMPSSVPAEDNFILRGEGVYDAWHHLWNVRMPLPTIDVPRLFEPH